MKSRVYRSNLAQRRVQASLLLSFRSILFDNEALTSKFAKSIPCCVEAIRSTNTVLSHPGEQTQNTQT